MENQIISEVNGKTLDKLKVQSIERDLQLSDTSGAETINTQSMTDSQVDELKDFAKQIIQLDEDSKKSMKIFNILLKIKEKYPTLPEDEFLKVYLLNNGLATSTLIELVNQISKKVNRYYSNPESIKIADSFDNSDLNKLEKYRKRMTNALSVLGIAYTKTPNIKTLANDFNNIVVKQGAKIDSVDWDSITDSITNVANTVNATANAVGSVASNISNVQNSINDAFSSRTDVVVSDPVSTDSQTASDALKVLDSTSSNTGKYILIGVGGLVAIVALIMLLK